MFPAQCALTRFLILQELICKRVLETKTGVNAIHPGVTLVGAGLAAAQGPGDGGRDLIVNRPQISWVVDCKAYAEGRPVTAKDVRSIMGALRSLNQTRNAGRGYVVTTSHFSSAAEQAQADWNRNNGDHQVSLVDGGQLREWIKDVMRTNGASEWLMGTLRMLEAETTIGGPYIRLLSRSPRR